MSLKNKWLQCYKFECPYMEVSCEHQMSENQNQKGARA